MIDLIRDSVFRANPGYELVLLDRLDAAELALIPPDERDDHELYGVLRPRHHTGLEARSVSVDTALLFLSLAQPGALPRFALRQMGDDAKSIVARLVLDGVVEVRRGSEFVSGVDSADITLVADSRAGSDHTAELSIAALRYGQELTGLAAIPLGYRLYHFGRQPISPALRARYPDETAVAEHLGLLGGGSAQTLLDRGWTEMAGPYEVRRHWRRWRAPAASLSVPTSPAANYKLYVSPDVAVLDTALRAVVGVLAAVPGVLAFKVGNDVAGICRPDKMVAYFGHLDGLHDAAAALSTELSGCPAHGVAFTAAVTRDGLLSWGADPPTHRGTGVPSTSWRMWVAERLAEYLVDARQDAPGEVQGWQYALRRLRLLGIDTETWVPTSRMWPEALENV